MSLTPNNSSSFATSSTLAPSNSTIPFKKSKYHELTEEEKKHNANLSKKRIKVEHTNRELKIYRIMKEIYRNHMNRYNIKVSIICGIYNMNHKL